jgi:hypothetical protein
MTGFDSVDLLLPPQARLFHIGPPKTASTALQAAAAARRDTLLTHGVRYPGSTQSHRAAIAGFLGRPIGWVGAPGKDSIAPDRAAWTKLLSEIEADRSRRIWFGHEYAAGANDQQAAELVEDIGPRIHVVVTLRDYGSMLPSIWQEYNKAGNTGTFDAWVKRVLTYPRTQETIDRIHVRHDQGALVRRWADLVGPDNLTVIVLDPADHTRVYRAFEAMLGLPAGLLQAGDHPGMTNRSLSVPEIELFRHLNGVSRAAGVKWPDYQRYIAEGAALRMLQQRSPHEGEQKLLLPTWAGEPVLQEEERHVREIAESGVRVVGALEGLAKPPRVRESDDEQHSTTTTVPLDAAVEALAGLLSAATNRGWNFQAADDTRPTAEALVGDTTAAKLALELAKRARRRMRKYVAPARALIRR